MSKKFWLLAAAGLLIPTAAAAQSRAAKTTEVIPSPVNNLAKVSGTPERLRRQNEQQPGNEMTTFAMFADGKKGLYFSMATELNGVAAKHRMQLALVPIELQQDAADGNKVGFVANTAAGKFVTANEGNEYRNANAPVAFAIDNGNAICAQYNYQPNNDSITYIQCFDATGATVMPQTESFKKNNDDCSMGESNGLQKFATQGNTEFFVRWYGCNGNGRDDAWVGVSSITKNGNAYTFKRLYDASVLAQEERSRGQCVVGVDKTVAFCGGTEGNNQPGREGAWLIAIDLKTDGSISGERQQNAILWKKQIGGRETIDGRRTYAMRVLINEINNIAADGTQTPTDMIFWRHSALEGNNNTNGKGGTNRANKFAVIKLSRTEMAYVTPPTDLARTETLGIDGTHNEHAFGVVGVEGQYKQALFVQNGSHTGGGYASDVRALTWDQTSAKFASAGDMGGPAHDRHLYSNYTGNNPGNQGRNHSDAKLIANPYVGMNGNNDKFLMVYTTSAKSAATMADPKKKLSAFIGVLPIAQGKPNAQAPGGTPGGGNGDGDGDGDGDGSDTSLGGCSAGGGSAGFAMFLLIGLATLIRRRR